MTEEIIKASIVNLAYPSKFRINKRQNFSEFRSFSTHRSRSNFNEQNIHIPYKAGLLRKIYDLSIQKNPQILYKIPKLLRNAHIQKKQFSKSLDSSISRTISRNKLEFKKVQKIDFEDAYITPIKNADRIRENQKLNNSSRIRNIKAKVDSVTLSDKVKIYLKFVRNNNPNNRKNMLSKSYDSVQIGHQRRNMKSLDTNEKSIENIGFLHKSKICYSGKLKDLVTKSASRQNLKNVPSIYNTINSLNYNSFNK